MFAFLSTFLGLFSNSYWGSTQINMQKFRSLTFTQCPYRGGSDLGKKDYYEQKRFQFHSQFAEHTHCAVQPPRRCSIPSECTGLGNTASKETEASMAGCCVDHRDIRCDWCEP